MLSIILILMGIAVPNYQQSLLHARETVLHNQLYTLRSAIDQYTLDKQKAPQSLSDLVSAGYLKQLPKDPMTNSNDTWQVDQEDSLMAVDQTEPGIVDVHSGSSNTASDGTTYNTW